MLPLSSAVTILDQIAATLQLEIESINSCDGFGRVLAASQYSRLTLPQFNKSAMDGYAIAAWDKDNDIDEYLLTETVAAGQVAHKTLLPGTTIKVMTGAPVPPYTAVVVPIEMMEEVDGNVKLLAWPKTSNICLQGEDVKCGNLILPAGKTITPAAIANFIACGVTKIDVYRAPRVVIISTGDEIVDDFSKITSGKIMDSNGPMLFALCKKHGLEVVDSLHVADDYQLTVKTLEKALDVADIVLLTGGVSVGDFDFVAKAFDAAGLTTHFDSVSIKPGKPITFASLYNFSNAKKNKKNNKLVFGLPGNPISAYLTFYLFVLRALRVMLGEPAEETYTHLTLADNFKRSKAERIEYVPCKVCDSGMLMPINFHGSAHLAVLLRCDGFFVVPQDVLQIAAGKLVQVLLT